jgi:heptaprenyl diphosphate synthase
LSVVTPWLRTSRLVSRDNPDEIENRFIPITMLWLKSADVQKDLQLVETGLLDAVECDDPFVSAVCRHLINAGGKRLRPALLLLTTRFGGRNGSRARSVAVAIELLHIATLYHDDVVDQAVKRRQCVSVNAKWGNQVAVLAGTYLLSRAMYLFSCAGDKVGQAVSRAINTIWKGQMEETEGVYNLDLEETRLFNIIAQKTATLYELACHIGSVVSGLSNSETDQLAEYGRNLGIAFQLVDDAMDIMADEKLLGKPPGSDLREGIYTLPVLYTLRSTNADAVRLRAILAARQLTEERLFEALSILRRNGSIHYTVNTALAFIVEAKKRIQGFPNGDAKQSLCLLGDFLIDRIGPA